MLESRLSRRKLLQYGAIAGSTLLAGKELLQNPERYLGAVGTALDWLIPPAEEYGFREQTNSRPRRDNEPSVLPDPRPKTERPVVAEIDCNHTLPILTLPEIAAQGQFSGIELSAGFYTFAGCSVITTREGLQHGRQEYAALFVHNQQVLAVGFETHRVALLDTVAKEWEDLISTDESPEFAVLTMPSIWPALLQTRFFKGSQGLLETIEFGNQVQAHHEYQPFYGVLPTTQMPNSTELQLTPENVVSNSEEALSYEKPYYITADGILIDMNHITDKPRTALQWLMQLRYYELFNAKHASSLSTATINTNYLGGNPNQVEFQVSLDTPLCEQTILTMMSAFTIATEGVMQYEIVAQTRNLSLAAEALSKNSGFSPEDAFTNTLAAHFAYQIFTEPNGKYAPLIERTLNKWLSLDSHILKPEMLNQLSEEFIYLPEFDELYKEVLERLIAVSPCQPLPEPIVLPTMGFYPFNPVKALKNDLNPQFQFDPPATTKGVVLTKFPNWAESLPKSGTRLLDRLQRFFTGN